MIGLDRCASCGGSTATRDRARSRSGGSAPTRGEPHRSSWAELALAAAAIALGLALVVGALMSLHGCASTAPDGRQLVVADPEGCGLGWSTCTIVAIGECGEPPGEGVTPGQVLAYSACVAGGVQRCYTALQSGPCARVPIGGVSP